jgi:hypothetical protein
MFINLPVILGWLGAKPSNRFSIVLCCGAAIKKLAILSGVPKPASLELQGFSVFVGSLSAEYSQNLAITGFGAARGKIVTGTMGVEVS